MREGMLEKRKEEVVLCLRWGCEGETVVVGSAREGLGCFDENPPPWA